MRRSSFKVRLALHITEVAAAARRRMIDIPGMALDNPAHWPCDEWWQTDGSVRRQRVPPKMETLRSRRSAVPTPTRHGGRDCDQILSQLTPKPRPLGQTTYADCFQFHPLFKKYTFFSTAPTPVIQPNVLDMSRTVPWLFSLLSLLLLLFIVILF